MVRLVGSVLDRTGRVSSVLCGIIIFTGIFTDFFFFCEIADIFSSWCYGDIIHDGAESP